MSTNGDHPDGTSGALAVRVDHYVYVIGGHTMVGNVNSVYRLNLKTRQWEKLADDSDDSQKPSPRDKFTGWQYRGR